MRVLITGANGQLGLALRTALRGHVVLATDVEEMDITSWLDVRKVLGAFGPDVVVHGAAFTNVDACESECEQAYVVNAVGTQHLANACAALGAAMVYVSTNYVFDGLKTEPYLEFDDPNPVSVYGRSKLAGETAVRSLLPRHYIVRTAWLYGDGPRNFVRTVCRLLETQERIRMVADEVASPTYAPDLAGGIAKLIGTGAFGTYHLTNDGWCSRLDFTREIARLVGREHVELEPIRLADYERPARPPLYSVLRNLCAARLGVTLRPWQEALAEYLCESRS